LRLALVFVHASLAASFSASALAEGAVAFGLTTTAVAVAIRVDHPTSDAAASDALAGCNNMAASEKSNVTCKVVARFKRQCAVYARGLRSAAWFVAAVRSDAEKRALVGCGAKSDGCRILISTCDVRD
jgi:Domain of unknown function (DUF4189)